MTDYIGEAGVLGIGFAVGLVVCLVIVRLRRTTEPEDPAVVVEQWRADAEGYRATFCDAVERAHACKAVVDQPWVDRVLTRFDDVLAHIDTATSDEMRKNLVDRAEELERLRAFVLPDEDLLLQAKVCVADMTDWGVPRATLRTIRLDLFPVLEKGTSKEKRAALQKVFEFYDAWWPYVDDWEEWSKRTAKVLTALLAGSMVLAVIAAVLWWPLVAFLAAGLAGATASVLTRLPPMLGWSQWTAHTPRILGRLATGVAGTLVGGALLVIGVVSVGGEGNAFADALAHPTSTSSLDALSLLGFGVLFGFTERLLVRIDPFRAQSRGDKRGAPAPGDD